MVLSTTILLIVIAVPDAPKPNIPLTPTETETALLNHLDLLESKLHTLHTHLAILQNATQYLNLSFAASTGSAPLPADFKFPRFHIWDGESVSASTVLRWIIGVAVFGFWFAGFGVTVEGLKAYARERVGRHKTLTSTVLATGFFAYCGFVGVLLVVGKVLGGQKGMQWWMLVLNGLWGFYAGVLGMISLVNWEGSCVTQGSASLTYELVRGEEEDLEGTSGNGGSSGSEASGLPEYEEVAPSGSSAVNPPLLK